MPFLSQDWFFFGADNAWMAKINASFAVYVYAEGCSNFQILSLYYQDARPL